MYTANAAVDKKAEVFSHINIDKFSVYGILEVAELCEYDGGEKPLPFYPPIKKRR